MVHHRFLLPVQGRLAIHPKAKVARQGYHYPEPLLPRAMAREHSGSEPIRGQ